MINQTQCHKQELTNKKRRLDARLSIIKGVDKQK